MKESKRMEDRKRFGEYVRSIRHEKGISIKELALRLGYDTRGMISGLESGNAPLPVEQIHRLARALDTPVEQILARIREYEPELYQKYTILEADITEDFRRKVVGRSSVVSHETAAYHAFEKGDINIHYQNLAPMEQLTLDLKARPLHDRKQNVLVFPYARNLGVKRIRPGSPPKIRELRLAS